MAARRHTYGAVLILLLYSWDHGACANHAVSCRGSLLRLRLRGGSGEGWAGPGNSADPRTGAAQGFPPSPGSGLGDASMQDDTKERDGDAGGRRSREDNSQRSFASGMGRGMASNWRGYEPKGPEEAAREKALAELFTSGSARYTFLDAQA
jgi:hypothetical protein